MKSKNIVFLCLLILNLKLCSQSFIYPASDYITEQFKYHNIICLDEGPHGTIEAHKFIEQLVSNNKVKRIINYIIIEFANIQYQDLLDRFIAGKDVSQKELQIIWRSTTQAHTPLFEMPVYFNFLKTIRDNNLTLQDSEKIRVLAGDPYINWNKIYNINDYFQNISQRDVLPSELAIKYGVDSSKKVLIIYGGEHLLKTSSEKKDSTYWTIPYYINKKHPGSVITIGILDTKELGFNDNYIPLNSIIDLSAIVSDNQDPDSISIDFQDNILNISNKFDALYYCGDSNKWNKDVPGKIDIDYWKELNRRSMIVWGEGIDENLKE